MKMVIEIPDVYAQTEKVLDLQVLMDEKVVYYCSMHGACREQFECQFKTEEQTTCDYYDSELKTCRRSEVPIEGATNEQAFVYVFGIDAWKQMIEFSKLNEQFSEFWTAPYNAESEDKE